MKGSLEKWYKDGHEIKIKGLKIFFKREGAGNNLICLHGFPTSSLDFQPIWSQLIQHFDVLIHDLVGLGRSEKPKHAITVALQADIVEQLALDQNIGKAHLLAHDLGDTVAQELLARQAEGKSKVEWLSCIFLNGGLFAETYQPRFIQKLLISPIGQLVASFTTANTFRKNMEAIFSKKHPPSETFLADSWKLLIENNGKQAIPRVIRYMKERSQFRERWVTPLEKEIVPMRLINGVEDPISGRNIADRYRELVPNADIILLEEVGHYPQVEVPEEVWKAIAEFHKVVSL